MCDEEEDARERRLFDISAPESATLLGHIGPVTSLSLTPTALYSGSWDYTVRRWERGGSSSWECGNVLRFDDWVAAVAARGPNVIVAAGPEVRLCLFLVQRAACCAQRAEPVARRALPHECGTGITP